MIIEVLAFATNADRSRETVMYQYRLELRRLGQPGILASMRQAVGGRPPQPRTTIEPQTVEHRRVTSSGW